MKVPVVPDEPIVAVGLLTQKHVDYLKDCLPEIYQVVEDDAFRSLLQALDLAEADRKQRKP